VRVVESTIVTLLQMRAEQQPDSVAYTFVSDCGRAPITYAELDRRARAVGGMLAGRHMRGAPVLLLYPPGLDYIAGFFGCLYAGAIAVPAYPPAQPRLGDPHCRLAAVARDAVPSGVLTSAAVGATLSGLAAIAPEFSRLCIMTTDGLPSEQAWHPFAAAPESVALLQYTSGSTSAPKGVVLTHGNLMSGSETIFRLFGHCRESRGVTWLPPYHDMGLIGGIIQPLYGGFPVTLMASADFLRRPLRWLEEISRTRATTSGGPNFAYDLCLRKTTKEERSRLDLSSWLVAFNGSEPVRAETMERFARAFAVSGFRPEAFQPCYGLAEATLLVTGGIPWSRGDTRSFDVSALQRGVAIPGTADAKSRRLVPCGAAPRDHRVLIVDPSTRTERTPGEIGEIWIAGPVAARSYWQRPGETREVLDARLVGPDEGPFVRSGDLGFILDQRLYVMGRIKDLIVIRGRNHHPQDIELTAEHSSPVLRRGRGAAFAVAADGEEQLVIVTEVSLQAGHPDVGEVAAAVRAAVAAEHRLQVHTVVLLPPGGLPKTSSGKVQRRLCAALFEQGGLPELGRSALARAPEGDRPQLDQQRLLAVPAKERRDLLRDYLCRLVASACRVEAAEVADVPLLVLGVDSYAMIYIQHSVKTDLGVHLTMADLSQAVSLTELAGWVDERLNVAVAPRRPVAPFADRSLWFLRDIEPGTAEHRIAIVLRIRSELDVSLLDCAVESLVTSLVAGGRVHAPGDIAPCQWIAGSEARAWLQESDVGDVGLADCLERAAREPFDLDRGPLLRVHLYRQATPDPVLLVVTHHFVADFWSLSAFVREFELWYTGQPGSVSPPDLTDFVRQYSWISGSRVSAAPSPGFTASSRQGSGRSRVLRQR
jgi:acyl-CoA synthetase (AMP-forming)/AMP-acid ligase II